MGSVSSETFRFRLTCPAGYAAKPEPSRLARGQLSDPHRIEPRIVARAELLAALCRLAPEAVEDLGARIVANADALPPEVLTDAAADVPAFLVDWARAWDLGDDDGEWVAEAALESIRDWCEEAASGGEPDWGMVAVLSGRTSLEEARRYVALVPYERTFPLPDQRWDLLREPKPVAYRRVMKELGARVRAELDRIEAGAIAEGLLPAEIRPAWRRHVEWFVLYQVKGRSPAEIAADTVDEVGNEIDESTVRKGIERAASLVDLPLRGGRARRRPPH